MAEEIFPPPPRQPTTKQIPAVSVPGDTLNAVLAEVRATRSDVHALKGDVDMLVGQGQALSIWRGEMEEWRANVDSAISRGSARAREPSEHDLEAKSQLAQEREAREALTARVETLVAKTDAQTAILTSLEGNATRLAKNPRFQALLVALITFATAWLVRHT